jgi:hypothetical protein
LIKQVPSNGDLSAPDAGAGMVETERSNMSFNLTLTNNYTRAADKFRAAAVALEASERTTDTFVRQMWRNHSSALLRQGHSILRSATYKFTA